MTRIQHFATKAKTATTRLQPRIVFYRNYIRRATYSTIYFEFAIESIHNMLPLLTIAGVVALLGSGMSPPL